MKQDVKTAEAQRRREEWKRNSFLVRSALRLCVSAVIFLFVTTLNAATIWLSTNGSDGNSGSEASPKLTMSGAMAVAVAGDTIKYKDTPSTLYTNRTQMIDDTSGGYKNSITFDLNGCTLRPPHLNSADNVYLVNLRSTTNQVIASMVATKGFLDGTNNFWGSKITDGAHHITFTNLTMANTSRSHNLLVSPGSGSGVTFVTVTHCLNTNAGWNRQIGTDNELHGFYFRTSSNVIEDSTGYIGNPKGTWALHQFSEADYRPIGNIYRRNLWMGGGDAGSVIISQSHYQQVIDSIFIRTSGSAGYGIQITDHADSNLVANCTFYNVVAAVNVGNSGDCTGNRVINNIATGSTSSSGAIGVGPDGVNTVISNNLAYANDDSFVDQGTGTVSGSNKEDSSFNAQFVDAANGDFHIGTTSSAKGAGLTLTEFSTDKDLVAFATPRSIGAYEFVPGSGLPQVTITMSSANAFKEGSVDGVVQLGRSGSTAGSLLVNFELAGTAVNSTDYTTLATNKTFATGQATTNVIVDPLYTGVGSGDKTFILNLWTNSAYDITSPTNATMTIRDGITTQAPSPGRTIFIKRR